MQHLGRAYLYNMEYLCYCIEVSTSLSSHKEGWFYAIIERTVYLKGLLGAA